MRRSNVLHYLHTYAINIYFTYFSCTSKCVPNCEIEMWMCFKLRHYILSKLRALVICNHHYGVESVVVARQGHRQQLPGVIALVVPNLRRERSFNFNRIQKV